MNKTLLNQLLVFFILSTFICDNKQWNAVTYNTITVLVMLNFLREIKGKELILMF